MDIFKWLLGVLYKVFIVIRERFFLIPPPESHPSHSSLFTGEGMGGVGFQQEHELAQRQLLCPPPVYHSGKGDILIGKGPGEFKIPPGLEDRHISLCETLDRVLNTGVVVHGDITISVANIDLIYIGLRALLASVETARQTQAKP